jgi:glycosyltransferase involved in cell wall biosynthesis
VNLLLIDQFTDPGGAQLCLLDLLPAFLERGWKVQLAAPGAGRLSAEAASLGIGVHQLPLGPYSSGSKTIGDALRFGADMARTAAVVQSLVRRHRIDLIYVNGPRPLAAVARTGLPTVFHSHSVLDKAYARLIAASALRRCGAAVMAVSRFVANSWAGIERVHTVYTGVSDQLAGAFSRVRQSPVTIGIIGRIAPEKGHADFMKAARLVIASGGEARFVVYGAPLFSDPGYYRRVLEMARGLPVEFRGWLDDTPSMYRQIDVVAMPSRANEAAPRVALEALSAGVPVAAYGAGGVPEIVEHGISGLVTSAPAPSCLAACLSALIDSAELRVRLGAGGRRAWETRFTLERYRRGVCDFVELAWRRAERAASA